MQGKAVRGPPHAQGPNEQEALAKVLKPLFDQGAAWPPQLSSQQLDQLDHSQDLKELDVRLGLASSRDTKCN